MYKIANTIFYILIGVMLHFTTPIVQANTAEPIGEVTTIRGGVSAKSAAGEVRVLGKNSPIYQGDVITSSPKSFAVIKMIDGASFSIRPDSVFSFENYSAKENEESAVMKLFKGGMRAVSGLISKKNPDAFKLNTSVATIGIRGTDFDARLCEVDCAIENQQKDNKLPAVAKVAFLKGDVSAVSSDNEKRKLKIKSAIYEGDTVITAKDAYAVLAFNDESRMTLKAETEIKIEKHSYTSPDSEENGAVYNLFKGGVRALTGLLSKAKKDNYKLKTPTATIGIRGTGYDVVWLGACTGGGGGCGLQAAVWLGSIYAKNEAGEFTLLQNQAFAIRFKDSAATTIDTPPIFIIPRPDKVNINFNELFAGEGVPSGLYVNTRDGKIFMQGSDGSIIEMQRGEGGFVSKDGSVVVKLDQPMFFQTNDPFMQIINDEFGALFQTLSDGGFTQSGFECVVQ